MQPLLIIRILVLNTRDSIQAVHLRHRVSKWVPRHRTEQYLAPHGIQVYFDRKPQIAQKWRSGNLKHIIYWQTVPTITMYQFTNQLILVISHRTYIQPRKAFALSFLTPIDTRRLSLSNKVISNIKCMCQRSKVSMFLFIWITLGT